MNSEVFVSVLIRALPAIIVFALGFIAATDKRTRNQWCNLLYQVGSIKSSQKEDVKIGSTVKWPFFVVAAFLLAWPVKDYIHSTRTLNADSSDLVKAKPAPESDLKSADTTHATDKNAVQTPQAPRSDLSPPTTPPTTTSSASRPGSDLEPR